MTISPEFKDRFIELVNAGEQWVLIFSMSDQIDMVGVRARHALLGVRRGFCRNACLSKVPHN